MISSKGQQPQNFDFNHTSEFNCKRYILFVSCIFSTREQAEDVIGSLLKEYLKGTKKEEEIVCDSNGSDGISSTSKQNEEISGASEKNDGTPGASEKSGEIQDAKEKSDEVSETGERNALMNDKDRDPVVNHVPENDANGPETSEVASEKNGSQHSCCNPENGTKQFKNVVAIVDPPRGGLHPIVSILFYCRMLNYKLGC